jgi:hypothetical protein
LDHQVSGILFPPESNTYLKEQTVTAQVCGNFKAGMVFANAAISPFNKMPTEPIIIILETLLG